MIPPGVPAPQNKFYMFLIHITYLMYIVTCVASCGKKRNNFFKMTIFSHFWGIFLLWKMAISQQLSLGGCYYIFNLFCFLNVAMIHIKQQSYFKNWKKVGEPPCSALLKIVRPRGEVKIFFQVMYGLWYSKWLHWSN